MHRFSLGHQLTEKCHENVKQINFQTKLIGRETHEPTSGKGLNDCENLLFFREVACLIYQ